MPRPLHWRVCWTAAHVHQLSLLRHGSGRADGISKCRCWFVFVCTWRHRQYSWQQPKSSLHQPEQAKWFHRSNYISCSKAHRRFNYGFQRHYNDFMTENRYRAPTKFRSCDTTQRTWMLGWELCEWFDRCARDGCRPRRGCAAGWRRCDSARTRMSPNKHGGTVFRDVGRKWSFFPGCSALSDNMWFWYWHDPEVNETCNKMC